jgi:myo-inositol-1(or 4)-monophosphatase
MTPSLPELEQLARQAGEILRAGFGKMHEIRYKGVIDVVTEIDHHSEDFLLGEIRRRYPNQRIVTEESGEFSGDGRSAWFIDPLDGTVNYSHGLPIFCVSIGYSEADSLQLGVVYDPNRDECFSAERGKGAWLNGNPINVSHESSLNNSLLVTGFPYDIRTNPDNNLDHYADFSVHSQAVRRLGSAALDLCNVAAGRFDGYWEAYLSTWDVAAGILIAREAGAVVTNMDGGLDIFTPPIKVVAANAKLHALLLQGLRGQFPKNN